MSTAIMGSRNPEVKAVIGRLQNPQMTYVQARSELARIITQPGAKICVKAVGKFVVGQEPIDSVCITLEVGEAVQPLTKVVRKGNEGKIATTTGKDYFLMEMTGTLMNDVVQAVKRAYFNWKARE